MSKNTTKELAEDSDSENLDQTARVMVHVVLLAALLMLAWSASSSRSRASGGGATIDLNEVAFALMWCSVAAYAGISSLGLRSESMSGLLKMHGLAFVLAVPAGIGLVALKVFLLGPF